MTLIKILQNNAEWMCAVAITFFTAIQCWLTHQQNIQSLRLKRLELANELDKTSSKFLGERSETIEILQWLTANASNFIFLLNQKDRLYYKKLFLFLMNYKNSNPENCPLKMEAAIKELNIILGELDSVLGNANYGFANDKDEIEKMKKNKNSIQNTNY
ncbi:unknown [Clostridium sp. CAG:768]|nr:unknown [Clostridium sp. CAG:768]